ncbi:MAG TPA: metallophosphoesterase family protein [Kofleriaceae bacterium]|jgi:hypothetical protein
MGCLLHPTKMITTWVMGDPQAPFETVMAVLRNHGALDGDRLRSDVRLISVGDHFDYDLENPASAGREGLRVLRWLASHDAAQVTIVAGNHDVSRVMELASISDVDFAAAQVLAKSILETRKRDGDEAEERRTAAEFAPRFPSVPTIGLAARDYASFTSEQRALVVELLLAGRYSLATAGTLVDGRRALITHAGVTQRELDMLGLSDERDADVIAKALQAMLSAAVEKRRSQWERGDIQPLDLSPLHEPGQPGIGEGGGLLYHRPSRRDRPGADIAWEYMPSRPRRFSPFELPLGLTQICGHTGHSKCVAELGDEWPTERARAQKRGGIRTLRRAADNAITYDLGVAAPEPNAADLVLVDGEMYRVEAATYQLLRLG